MEYRLAEPIANLLPSATEEVDNTIKQMRREGVNDLISFGVGEPCFDTPVPIKQAAQQALDAGITKYQPTAGSFELREAICQKLQADNGIHASVEEIIVTPGAKFAIYLFFRAMIEPGDRVILLDPSWVSHDAIPRMSGAEVVRIPSFEANGYQPDLEAIENALRLPTRCIILNSPCNPTGSIYPPETIRRITEMARNAGAVVLSDEIYEALVYEGEMFSPASEYDNVVTVNGFSKTYAMTGWRLGYVTGPVEILDGMLKIYQHSTSCVTAFAQAGAVAALQNPEARSAMQWMMGEFRRKRDLMVDCLNRSQYLQCSIPEGAFYCFPSFKLPLSSVDLAQALLREAHVATVPGAAFGDCGEAHLRLSFAAEDQDILTGLERVETFFQKHANLEKNLVK